MKRDDPSKSPKRLRIISLFLLLAGLPLYFAALNGHLGDFMQRHSRALFFTYPAIAAPVMVWIEWKIRPWFKFEIWQGDKTKPRVATLICLSFGLGMYFLMRQGYLGSSYQSFSMAFLITGPHRHGDTINPDRTGCSPPAD